MNDELEKLEKKAVSSLVNGQLPCTIAFKIAGELKARLQDVGEIADSLGIRVVKCQLGCFP